MTREIIGQAGPITIAGCNAAGSVIKGTTLTGCRIEASNLAGAVFEGTTLGGAKFRACDLSGVEITGSGFAGMTINGMSVDALIAAYRKVV
jgi:uncharacterized protein YjbI with pentapeptide repeats